MAYELYETILAPLKPEHLIHLARAQVIGGNAEIHKRVLAADPDDFLCAIVRKLRMFKSSADHRLASRAFDGLRELGFNELQ